MKEQTILEMMSLKDKTALITGAAQGIGLQIATRLAEAGANIAIADLDSQKAGEAASKLEKDFKIAAMGYEMDVSKSGSVSKTIDEIDKDFDGIDILVNNAGVYPMISIRDITEKDFDFLMDINLKGTFLVSQAVVEKMIAREIRGKIVNIASTAAVKTAGNSAHYVASKHAIAGWTQSQAVELGQYGIKSITVAPTLVDTPGTKKLREDPAIDKQLQKFESSLPLGRMARPDDIAKTVVFAASGLSDFITGIIIPVDGGETSL